MPIPATFSELDRAALEKRLAVAEKKLDEVLPVRLKFERGEPSPDVEARLQPLLDDLFAGDQYTLECRDQVCRLASKSRTDWQMALQTDAKFVGLIGGASFGRDVFFRVENQQRSATIQTALAPIYALLASPALPDCKRGSTAEGTLRMSLKLTDRRFVVATSGPLANEPVGTCIRKALEDIAAATPIPSGVTSSDEVPFPVPIP